METIECLRLPRGVTRGTVYKLVPNPGTDMYYERTDRHLGWIRLDEQTILRECIVAVAGCGGMGGLILDILIRLGVGEVRIADPELFDKSNLNRQYGAMLHTLGKNKAVETANKARLVVDDTTIVVYMQGITIDTVDSFVKGCDLICDEAEFFAVVVRILLHRSMRKYAEADLLNCPTVGHQVYITKFTAQSMTIEEVLGMTYEEAVIFEQKVRDGTATTDEIDRVTNAMLAFVAPEIPEYSADTEEYSTQDAVLHRLRKQKTASIIATNPPMASGFLSNQILYHLLSKKSPLKRNYALPPVMPGYFMFDAGKFRTSIVKEQWWGKDIKTVLRMAMTDADHQCAQKHIERHYRALFGTTPARSDEYIVAYRNDRIVGVVALDFAKSNGKILIEDLYDIHSSTLPATVTAKSSIQVGRWIASDEHVSMSLAYASALRALYHGKLHGWVNHTDAVHKVLTKKGIKFHALANNGINLAKVRDEDLAFYTKHTSTKPYIMNFYQIIEALHDKLELYRENGIVFDLHMTA